MLPTSDTFRALAASSPWLFRTLHLTHRDGGREVEAWLRRPVDLVVRDGDRLVRHLGPPQSVGAGFWFDPETGRRGRMLPMAPTYPLDVEPRRRPDGLVAHRPEGVEYGDPMHHNYRFVAGLDPVELSAGTTVTDVRVTDRAGRPTLTAVLRPTEEYEPRCGCCPLLFSEISQRHETEGTERPAWHEKHPTARYLDAYRVGLDAATGVVVELHPVGGHGLPDLDLSVDLHAVDTVLDEVVDAVPPPARPRARAAGDWAPSSPDSRRSGTGAGSG